MLFQRNILSDMRHLFGHFPSESFSLWVNTPLPCSLPHLCLPIFTSMLEGPLPAREAHGPGSPAAGRSEHPLSSGELASCVTSDPSSAGLETFASMWTLDRGPAALHWVLHHSLKASTEEMKPRKRHLLYSTHLMYQLSALGNGTLNGRWSLPKYHHQITEKTFY